MIGPYALIVPTGVLKNSSDVFGILDPDSGGAATFSVKLSANGLEPPTHYGAYTLLEEATYNALVNMTTTQFKAYLDTLADSRGRTRLESSVAFKNAVVVRNTTTVPNPQGGTMEVPATFWQIVADLGLKRVETGL